MKKLILMAALASLAACSKSEPAPAPEPAAEATMEAVQTMAADGKPSTGTYKITTADGEVIMTEVKADGTYADTMDGKVIETGKWVQKSPAQYCWTKDEAGATEICADEKVVDGVYTSYNPVTKKTATVERVEG